MPGKRGVTPELAAIVRTADDARIAILETPEWRGVALTALDDITRIALTQIQGGRPE